MCPETDWNIRTRKRARLCVLTDFKKWFWCFIPDINQCVNNYFQTEKSWSFFNLRIICLLGLSNLRNREQWFSVKANFVWFSLARLPTAQVFFFWDIFLKEKQLFLSSSCFSYLFNASTRLFRILSFAQSATFKHRGKTFLMMNLMVRGQKKLKN